MRFDRDKFFKEYRRQFGALEHPFQVEGLNALLDAMSADAKLTDVRIAAYMLATVHHECQLPINKVWKPTYQPVEERGKGRGRKYAKSYPVSRHDAVKTAVYFGRGYVQLTWLENYRKAGAAVGVDLVNYPEKALEPAVAYLCLAEGLRRGWYGSKITTHINATKCDYFNARRCVNILDKAAQIAEYAEKFERALRVSLTQDEPRTAQRQAEAETAGSTMPASDEGRQEAAEPVADATDAPPANEGEPAPDTPAQQGEAVVGGRPSDPIIKLPSSLGEAQVLAEKAKSYLPDGSDTTKRWATRSAAGAALVAAWRWVTDPTHLIPILILIGVAALFIGGWLLSRFLTKKHARALEAAERARLQTQGFELQKLKLQAEMENARRLADPSQYNVVVDTGVQPVAEKEVAS